MKMIVLLLASTGSRLGGLGPGLQVRYISKPEDGSAAKVTSYARTPDKYVTYCTPECYAAICAYLESRTRAGEKVNPDSHLIRKQFDVNDIGCIRMQSEPVTVATLCKLLNSHLIKAGLRTIDHVNKNNRKEVARANGFRKFFTGQLIEADIKTELRWLTNI